MNLRDFWRRHRVDIVLVGVIFLLAGVPRLLDLGIFLTADEKNWIGRSFEFVRAFKDFRFNDMLQTTHPGVTTLWLMGLTVYATVFIQQTPFAFSTLVSFVWSTQFSVALANTFLVAALYVLARLVLTGANVRQARAVAFFGAVFVALDPFYIGYSRVAHVDAMLAGLLVLACLSMIRYAQTSFSRKWLAISAILSALALLTKAPAVFALPFFILTVIVYGGMRPLSAGKPARTAGKYFWVDRGRDFLLWLLIIGLIIPLLWPALIWVDNPQGNALVLKRDLSIAASTPHNMSEEYTLNGWHYPAALLGRTTPVTLVLLIVFLGAFIWQWRRRALSAGEIRLYALLLAYVFFFVLMMTLGAKKGDRYILPVWPMIDVAAAAAIFLVVPYRRRLLAASAAAIYLAAVVWWYHPYTLAYSNPLFPDNISQELGWGEGLDQVAAWLNEHDPKAVVASWYPEELGAFTEAQVAHINAHEQNKVKYVVLYRNMFGRAPEHPANDFIDEYFKKRYPVFVARVAGKEFAWVYEKPVYNTVAGDLVPGRAVRQAITLVRHDAAGFDIYFATHLGEAIQGDVMATLRSEDGSVIQSWRVPVATLKDNAAARFVFDRPLGNFGRLVLEIEGFGTSREEKRSPTVRVSSADDVRPGSYEAFEDGSWGEKKGDLAVQVLYMVDEQLVSELHGRLLINDKVPAVAEPMAGPANSKCQMNAKI